MQMILHTFYTHMYLYCTHLQSEGLNHLWQVNLKLNTTQWQAVIHI